jgi:hypothetical protein|tara:strand:- start:76 stop:288 length:213 start_codon:yes stop_codon:yes gene_type:complete
MKLSDLAIIVLFAACIVLFVKGQQERRALDECVEDVSNKCISIYNYATALEKENARLNRLVRERRNNENR